MPEDDQTTDATSTSNLFGQLIGDAFAFATPFAQRLLHQRSTPTDLHQERITNAALNGSGPNDPTLAGQAPRGLLDFLTGARLTGQQGGTTSGGGGGLNTTTILIALVAIVAVVMLIRR